MSDLPFHQQAVLWGQAYEVLVKRGVLACLVEQKLVTRDRPGLDRWQTLKLLDVSRALTEEFNILDEDGRETLKAAVRHLALTAYGMGYTAMREYLKAVRTRFARNPDALRIKALWCPLVLPGESTQDEDAKARIREDFHRELLRHLSSEKKRKHNFPDFADPHWSRKGQPANADFLLWFEAPKEDYLLVQEYSYDMPGSIGNFREQGAHLDELIRHRRIVDSRGVFARVAAEVSGENFELSGDIEQYLGALTSENKPLYKLCQACSYAETTVELLRSYGLLEERTCQVRALAITPNGLESLSATFKPEGAPDARRLLMEQMARAYRKTEKLEDTNPQGLDQLIERVFKGMLNKLPNELRAGMKNLREMPQPGKKHSFEFDERVAKFFNPTETYTLDEALALVDESPELQHYFGGSPRQVIGDVMREFMGDEDKLSLRDVHAASIVAGMRSAKPGSLNVIALEGNPGIGKTTAVRSYLSKKEDGFLFLYFSPRVVINRDVTQSLARKDGEPTGILTITTNADLISSAKSWHEKRVEQGLDRPRYIDGAVVADGVQNLKKPEGSILVIDPEDEQEIDTSHPSARQRKEMISEYEDLVKDRPLIGVLRSMAEVSKEILKENPEVNRLVLTAALQGFRRFYQGKTTVDALSCLFDNKASTTKGIAERRAFARRMPTIVVMVDELAGDGAGAGFVHTIASWLQREFIGCFEDEPSPFTVLLIVSDASLGNEVVLDRYLNAGDRAPDKVLVSRSAGQKSFRLAVTKVKIGSGRHDTLHVMTNSFPASELHLHYRVEIEAVTPKMSTREHYGGKPQSPRAAIREKAKESALESALRYILKALDAGARQVIYFAQDKMFLRLLRQFLTNRGSDANSDDVLMLDQDALDRHGLNDESVQILDSSVPGWRRRQLVDPKVRDTVKVFLMTSSGARGVSFPLTDWIIANVPRFNIEAALMEIAQLIYRGRGMYRDETGALVSGDTVPRHLVMLVNDYLVCDGEIDKRQWLRQCLDLMTLLVMLRASIYTRITGDAGLRQRLALVPVGGVGDEEFISVMSQYVAEFVREARLFVAAKAGQGSGSGSDIRHLLKATAAQAASNVENMFCRLRLNALARRDADKRSVLDASYMEQLIDMVANPISPLLPLTNASGGTSIAEHIYFSGPVVVESWENFDKQEIFEFDGYENEITGEIHKLIGQLREIIEEGQYPRAMKNAAKGLLELLQRKGKNEGKVFLTLKELKSPNTWITVPAECHFFIHYELQEKGKPFYLEDQPLWHEALGQTLNAGSAIIPPLPRYESFPWVAVVGQVSPLRMELVFDDRYFMASNELNLLNTLLLAKTADTVAEECI